MALYSPRTLLAIRQGARHYKPFSIGNVAGYRDLTGQGPGWLPTEWERRFWFHRGNDEMQYAFYSFGTPLAWKVSGLAQWVIPDVKYSRTSTIHLGHFRSAIESAQRN